MDNQGVPTQPVVPVPPQPLETTAVGPPFVPPGRDNGGAQQAVGQIVQSGVIPTVPVATPPAAGSVQKEHLPAQPAEKVPLVELHEQEKIPEDVEGWMEKLEQAGEIKIPEPIKKDEQVLMDNATATSVRDTVVLPLSQQGAATAAKKTVSDSARWLYEWCKRLIKMLGDRAKYGEGV
jgi:hypothetical protein